MNKYRCTYQIKETGKIEKMFILAEDEEDLKYKFPIAINICTKTNSCAVELICFTKITI
jgi:hypothetical protein